MPLVIWICLAILWAILWGTGFSAAYGQSIDGRALGISRQTHESARTIVDAAGGSAETYRTIRDEHHDAFRRTRDAFRRATDWAMELQKLLESEEPSTDVAAFEQSLGLHWNIAARTLRSTYFERVKSLVPGEAPAIERLERRGWRRAMARAMSSAPWSAQIADLAELLQAIAPDVASEARVRAELDRYEVEIDIALKGIDRAGLEQPIRFRSVRAIVSEARSGPVPNIRSRLDELLPVLLAGAAERVAIDQAAERAITALRSELETSVMERLVHAANRVRFPLHFQGDSDVDRLLAALRHADLTEEQRSRLQSIEAEFVRAATAAVSEAKPLYERSRSVEVSTSRNRAWLYAASRVTELAAVAEADHAIGSEAEAALNAAVSAWAERAAKFRDRIREVIGRDVEPLPEATVEADEEPDEVPDPEAPVTPPPQPIGVDALFTPLLPKADFERRTASLDSGLGEAATQLYEELVHAYEAARVKLTAKQAAAEEAERRWQEDHPGEDPWIDHALDFGLFDAFAAWTAERYQREAAFESGVLAMLAPSAAEAWREESRRLRRARTLTSVQSVRAAIDLVSLMEGIAIEPERQVAVRTELDGYVESLDRALIRAELEREGILARLRKHAITRGERPTREELKAVQAINIEFIRLSTDVQELTEAAAGRIAEALGASRGREFADRFQRAKYPMLFKPSPAEIVLDALLSSRCEDLLGSELVTRLAETRSEYVVRRDELRARAIELNDEWERPDRVVERQWRWVANSREGSDAQDPPETSPATAAVRGLFDLAISTAAQVRQSLGAEILERCPSDVRLLLAEAE
jgi:hypothetical protein